LAPLYAAAVIDPSRLRRRLHVVGLDDGIRPTPIDPTPPRPERPTLPARRPGSRAGRALGGLLAGGLLTVLGIALSLHWQFSFPRLQGGSGGPPAPPASTNPYAWPNAQPVSWLEPEVDPFQPVDPILPGTSLPLSIYPKIIVRPGDTLGHLACLYDTTVANLQGINGLGTSTGIRAGQQLTVPNTMLQGTDCRR
jgi:hypothetical protein